MSRWAGPSRALVVVAAAAGLVLTAGALPHTIELRATAAVTPAEAAVVPVRQSALVCPGPETEGVAGVPAVTGGTTSVLATTAADAALGGIGTSTEPGRLTLITQSTGSAPAEASARGAALSASLAGPTLAEVRAVGSLAAGVAAVQTWLRRDSDDRGLVATACPAPGAEAWLLAGGGDPTRRERLLVANAGANPATVDVEVFGGAGRIATVGGTHVVVPPHGRVGLLVDALAPGEPTPAVHVTATGGLVVAVLEDSWIEGAVGRGRDDVGPAAGPSTEAVIPVALSGHSRLRVLVPGADEAVVQTRVLTSGAAQALPADGVVRVPGGTVRDIDLSGLPAGAYAVQVRADRPLVASVLTERRPAGDGPSDLAWLAASAPIPVLGGSPIPAGTNAALVLAGTGTDWSAVVYLVAPDGTATASSVSGPADSVVALDATGAASLWVRPATGTVRGSVTLELTDPGGTLVSVVPVLASATSTTDLPVRELRR